MRQSGILRCLQGLGRLMAQQQSAAAPSTSFAALGLQEAGRKTLMTARCVHQSPQKGGLIHLVG
jgi:hypothetical protein